MGKAKGAGRHTRTRGFEERVGETSVAVPLPLGQSFSNLFTKGENHEQEDSWIHESEVGLLLVRRLRGNRRWRARWRFHGHPVGGLSC